jgi:L-rhamnose mutarotase
MPQQAYHIVLRPGQESRYIGLHSPVPVEISQQLEAAGIYDFSIFIDEEHVFGVFRYDDEKKIVKFLANDVSPAWTKEIIASTLVRRIDPDLPLLKRLDLIFRFEGHRGT